MIVRPAVLATALLLVASVTAAQSREPVPRFVADVRGASAGLPTAQGWTPAVPTGAEVPARALGLEVGGHIRVARLGGSALAIGATLLTAKGTFSPEAAEEGAPTAPQPEVSTRLTSITPQLSLNFGRRLGWSYVSGGLGRARVRSETSIPAVLGAATVVEGGWSRVINFGGGARWFFNDHVGVTFDLRWYRLAAVTGDATRPPAPADTLLTVGVGISLQ